MTDRSKEAPVPNETTRRSLLTTTSALAVCGFLLPAERRALAADSEPAADRPVHPGYPTQAEADVREVVAKAHTDRERVQELVTARPELAKAAYDWGFGDWETALGAASHMGRRDIAELLIENGARPNIFYAAMSGNVDAVKAFVEAFPGIQSLHGPHGITLMAHATTGGEDAKPVVRYLEKVGNADMRYTNLPLSDEEKQAYLGTYAFGGTPGDRFEIEVNRRGLLSIRRGPGFGRALFHQGSHEFHPGGAPTARIRFAMEGARAVSFEIRNPKRILTADRLVAA